MVCSESKFNISRVKCNHLRGLMQEGEDAKSTYQFGLTLLRNPNWESWEYFTMDLHIIKQCELLTNTLGWIMQQQKTIIAKQM
jgi:hypothetical protein